MGKSKKSSKAIELETRLAINNFINVLCKYEISSQVLIFDECKDKLISIYEEKLEHIEEEREILIEKIKHLKTNIIINSK